MLPDLYGKSKEQIIKELDEALGEAHELPNCKVIREIWNFSHQTLDHHLKALTEEGIVEKVQEPRKQGERGRPSGRYRIRGCMHARLSVSRPAYPKDPRWFLGTKIGKSVRMYPEEKKKFEQLMKENETFRDAVLSASRKKRNDINRSKRLRRALHA